MAVLRGLGFERAFDPVKLPILVSEAAKLYGSTSQDHGRDDINPINPLQFSWPTSSLPQSSPAPKTPPGSSGQYFLSAIENNIETSSEHIIHSILT